MSEYTSILSRQEREWVQMLIAGELHIEENPKHVRDLLERMWTELEGWHRVAVAGRWNSTRVISWMV